MHTKVNIKKERKRKSVFFVIQDYEPSNMIEDHFGNYTMKKSFYEWYTKKDRQIQLDSQLSGKCYIQKSLEQVKLENEKIFEIADQWLLKYLQENSMIDKSEISSMTPEMPPSMMAK